MALLKRKKVLLERVELYNEGFRLELAHVVKKLLAFKKSQFFEKTAKIEKWPFCHLNGHVRHSL